MSAHPPPSATARRPETARAIRAMQAAMHVLFVLLFVVGLARALLTQTTTAPHLALLFVASALFMGLYCFGLTLERRPVSDARREQLAQVWISALVVAWIALLAVAADFAWLAFAFYFLVLYVARRALAAALVAVVLVASVVALASSNSTRGPGSLIGPFMGMLVALGIAWVYVNCGVRTTPATSSSTSSSLRRTPSSPPRRNWRTLSTAPVSSPSASASPATSTTPSPSASPASCSSRAPGWRARTATARCCVRSRNRPRKG
ncbi:hypothetical protein [Dermacoccus abyssi]|uniref:hypothetical protein n=1 Tax=Dermacoccus abyssi TaxID=322596 RepID=UPI001F4E2D6D|nr:hypothetical protein [Dermacoccus abyssi]